MEGEGEEGLTYLGNVPCFGRGAARRALDEVEADRAVEGDIAGLRVSRVEPVPRGNEASG